jgi:hypothetical protein
MLRQAGLSLLVGATLVVPLVASAAPALVFEPYSGTVVYTPRMPMPNGSPHR